MTKIKWGVLGAAEIAKECVIPAMRSVDEVELYAIASRSIEKAINLKNRFMFEKAYDSYTDIINDPEIEAVYIPLPNSLHKEWTMKAIAAGKHVLCEKPLAGNYHDVTEMFKASEKKEVVLQEGFAFLHSPLIKSVKFDVESGVIGDLQLIETVFFTPSYPDDNVTVMRETNGGALYDIGCYCISVMNYLLNKEVNGIVASSHFSHLGTDDFTSAWIDFGECKGVMMTGMCSPQRADRFVLHGTEGSIHVMLPFNAEGEVEYKITRIDKSVRTVKLFVKNNYELEIRNMNDSIKKRGQVNVSKDISIRQAQIIDKVLEAVSY